MIDADDRGDEAHRHDEDDGERQRQALELRREHEEHEHDTEREREHRGVAGPDLLVGELGPFVAEALRQRFGRQLLHEIDRLALRVAGRSRAIELGGRDRGCSAERATGAEMSRTVVNEPSGTVSPEELRTRSLRTSLLSMRKALSACAVTRNVRPSRLKSLT